MDETLSGVKDLTSKDTTTIKMVMDWIGGLKPTLLAIYVGLFSFLEWISPFIPLLRFFLLGLIIFSSIWKIKKINRLNISDGNKNDLIYFGFLLWGLYRLDDLMRVVLRILLYGEYHYSIELYGIVCITLLTILLRKSLLQIGRKYWMYLAIAILLTLSIGITLNSIYIDFLILFARWIPSVLFGIWIIKYLYEKYHLTSISLISILILVIVQRYSPGLSLSHAELGKELGLLHVTFDIFKNVSSFAFFVIFPILFQLCSDEKCRISIVTWGSILVISILFISLEYIKSLTGPTGVSSSGLFPEYRLILGWLPMLIFFRERSYLENI